MILNHGNADNVKTILLSRSNILYALFPQHSQIHKQHDKHLKAIVSFVPDCKHVFSFHLQSHSSGLEDFLLPMTMLRQTASCGNTRCTKNKTWSKLGLNQVTIRSKLRLNHN